MAAGMEKAMWTAGAAIWGEGQIGLGETVSDGGKRCGRGAMAIYDGFDAEMVAVAVDRLMVVSRVGVGGADGQARGEQVARRAQGEHLADGVVLVGRTGQQCDGQVVPAGGFGERINLDLAMIEKAG